MLADKNGGQPGTGAVPPSIPFVAKENLFSEHYLLNVLPRSAEWSSLLPVATRIRSKVLELLSHERTYQVLTEPDLDRQFFEPVFRELGHVAHIQVRTSAGDFPDYVFFESTGVKEVAEGCLASDREAFFQHAIALGELKRWDIPLDVGRSRRADDLDRSHPTGQLYGYMLRNHQHWAILTNGRKWRLYHYDGVWPRVGRYYEIDLPDLARHHDPAAFVYFVYFFRREAFVSDASGKTPLDRAQDGSVEYSQILADDLRDAAYRSFGLLANGFLRWESNQLDGADAKDRQRIHDGSLRLLYRILLVLKAESVGLLPLDNPAYRLQRSLDALKRMVRDRRTNPSEPILNDSDAYCAWLRRLFDLIDRGSAAPGHPDALAIPPYNGGLFRSTEPGTNQRDFLSTKSIGDADLAEVIDLLACHTGAQDPARGDDTGFVDYSSLESQQLGTIYEGLLEYKLGYADGEDYVAVGEEEKWIPLSRHTGAAVEDPARHAHAGTFFLETDKGQRHSTGSYYTPDFIVRNIIEKTLGSVLQRRLSAARANGASLKDAVLSLRVVDPAMGSGHFLVDVVDYLTPALLAAIDEDGAAGRLSADGEISTTDARREILAHCLYGVDLNPMAVELAKVTLWLHTLARGKPLSFLDHRLKTGDSLLGANVRRLSRYPDSATRARWASEVAAAREQRVEQRFTEPATFPPLFLERITGRIRQIEELRDETADDVKRKERIYDELRSSPELVKIRAIADAWMAVYFGVNASRDVTGANATRNYADLQLALHYSARDEEWNRKASAANLEEIQSMAEARHFFHWEFEFPEVFFDRGVLKDDSGFDAVVGNPPYVNINTIYEVDQAAPAVYEQLYESCGEGRYDLYVPFVERGFALLNSSGELGYILPNKWFKAEFGRPLRGLLSRRHAVRGITDWGGYYTLFRVGDMGPITFVAQVFLSKNQQDSLRYVTFPSLTAADNRKVAAMRLSASGTAEECRSREMVVGSIQAESLGDTPWIFTLGAAKTLLDRLGCLRKLSTVAKVFTGAQTSAQPIYVLENPELNHAKGTLVGWSEGGQRFLEIEIDATKPLLRGKQIARYRFLGDEAAIIFPYKLTRDAKGRVTSASLFSPEEMAQLFPKTWEYLNDREIRSILEAREPQQVADAVTGVRKEVGRFVGKPDWYSYTYPRAMTKFWQPKLVFPDASSQGTVAFDTDGRALVQSVYAIEMLEGARESPFFVQAILNSDVFTFFMQETSNRLKDGFFRFQTKYVEPFPLPEIGFVTPLEARDQLEEDALKFIEGVGSGRETDGGLVSWIDAQMMLGRCDVVHDAVAAMAERVNHLYSENYIEVRRFLRWFQHTYLKPESRLDDFSGKTKLLSYAETPVKDLFDVLRKNRIHLVVSPENPRLHDELEKAYTESVLRQRPRSEYAHRLESAIENAVYRLYELTPDEVGIVKETAAIIQYR